MISGGPTLLRMPAVALVVLLLTLPGGDVRAQDCLDYSAQAVWVGAMAGAAPVFKVIDVMESGLLVGATADSALVVCSLADPAHPAFLSAMDLGKVYSDLDCSGEYVYLCGASSSGVRIVRVAADGSMSDEGVLHAGLTVSDVDVDGVLLGLCMGGAWQLWDCSAAVSPQWISTEASEYDEWTKLSLDGDRAAVTGPSCAGLSIYDITDPAHPEYAGGWFNGCDDEGYYLFRDGVIVVGDLVYLLSSSLSIHNGPPADYRSHSYWLSVLDVSDPAHPVQVDGCDLGGNDYYIHQRLPMRRAGDRILVGRDSAGGIVILEAGASPVPIQLTVPFSGASLAGVGDHIYFGTSRVGLMVWRVPSNMSTWMFPAPATGDDLFSRAISNGDVVAVSALHMEDAPEFYQEEPRIDIYDPEISVSEPIIQLWGEGSDMTFAGSGIYYISDAGEVRWVDMADAESVANPAVVPLGVSVGSLEALGDTCLAVGDNAGNTRLYDVSDSQDPRLLSALPLVGRDLMWDAPVLLVANSEGVVVVDVQAPAAPVIRSRCPIPYAYRLVAVGDHRVVVSTYNAPEASRHAVIDYTVHHQPVIEYCPGFPYTIRDAAVVDGCIYAPGLGVHVVSAGDLSHVGSIASTHNVMGTVAWRDRIFGAGADMLVEIPKHCGTQVPVSLSSVRLALRSGAPVLSWSLSRPAGDEHFIVEGGRDALTWSVPVHPLGDGAYEARDTSPSAAIPGEATYDLYEIAGTTRTLLASEHLVLPGRSQALRLSPVTPNPFNPRTTVVFELPRPGRADLSVYDAAGRLVRRLAVGDLPAGSHTAVWDGRDDCGGEAPSGAYCLRLSGETGSVSRKAVLLR